MDRYDILLGQDPVGKAEVCIEGLYYRFRCRCELSGQVMYRLVVLCGGKQENLGVLIPVGDSFGLETKLAVKRLGKGKLEFRLLPKHTHLDGRFVPLTPDEPFSYISRVRTAYLARKDGKIGVVIQEIDQNY